ncbi:MAG: CHAP domain-containing protein [Candidatus Saccharimonadales bacterium]
MKTKSILMALFAVATLSLVSGHAANAQSEKPSATSEKSTKKVVYEVKAGDTLEAIAKEYDMTYVRLFNANKSIANPDLIDVDQKITIPAKDAKLPQRFDEYTGLTMLLSAAQPQQYAAQPTYTPAYRAAATPVAISYGGSNAGNTYAWGYCTWYVKNKRPDMPNRLGNGGQWAASAAAMGYATGSHPKAGAVAEQPGHVAYVENVFKKGNVTYVTISEMNYGGGIGQVNTRTVPASNFTYIY